MNQAQNTSLRGIIVGIATVVGTIWPQYATIALQAGGATYSLLAILKPLFPTKLQQEI